MFTPNLREDSHLTHIFQMGWFNHPQFFRGVTDLFFVCSGPVVSPPQAVINGRMYQSTVTGSNSGGVDDGDVSRVFGCAGIVF